MKRHQFRLLTFAPRAVNQESTTARRLLSELPAADKERVRGMIRDVYSTIRELHDRAHAPPSADSADAGRENAGPDDA